MSGNSKSVLFTLVSVLILLFAPSAVPRAQAALGSASSLGGKLVASDPGYSVRESTEGGTQVREYVLSDGTVFAVSWEGLSQPDLQALLGSYYSEYQSVLLQGSGYREGVRVLRSKRMVIERSGHMRDVRGLAYIPSLLPEGFELAGAWQ